jgi:hypothetical protein
MNTYVTYCKKSLFEQGKPLSVSAPMQGGQRGEERPLETNPLVFKKKSRPLSIQAGLHVIPVNRTLDLQVH